MGPQVCHRTASLKRVLTTVLISAVLGGGTMMTQISIGQISCPTFIAGHACTAIDSNPCSSGSCYTVSNEFYCTDRTDEDGNPARVQSQKVTNVAPNWNRCRDYTPTGTTTGSTSGYVSKSCAENIQVCGTTQNYRDAPLETSSCDELDKCIANWSRSACASFNPNPSDKSNDCFTNP